MNKVDAKFIEACSEGSLNNVGYFLLSSDLKKNADIHANDDEGLKCACEEGNLEVVKYLLTSPELKEHANIYANDCIGFQIACKYNHVDIVEYLHSSQDLDEHADIYSNNFYGFRSACIHNHVEVVKYFIFNAQMKLNKEIRDFLRGGREAGEAILQMFKNRDLEKKLRTTLKASSNEKRVFTKI